ncbi:MAG: molybdopterin molybdotransferase MoeA [Gammaproteobacteria bacterium]|nr:molybdopterin molybdotransferase MoeA [Gammaproteobacteria bacterium]MDG1230649.1 molybdopterin molybdotransferase MoeA [Pseudomonadales bacterium]MBT5155300.1 molybdopterin molybdotransferase MoeA [Gammaproteobacteria bacterium]MBT5686056.1 molybdopterin molybdotransferase MoeA [Gammaproteobacteria bacterium]MBT5724093.1 molybdopterin molybdotransferase MoeA [Gammaproteobacteria bacterium]
MSLRPVDEVVDQLLGLVKPTGKSELRTIDKAVNCCAAKNIQSPISVPPADNSAMDGYAIAYADANLQSSYRVSARIPAGYVGSRLASGTVARIFTGAEIPVGADTVVMQENTELAGDEVKLLSLPDQFENVRSKGQDIAAGSLIISKGDLLSARTLSLVASVGVAQVEVATPLRIAIMSTGDELVEPGNPVAPGQIYNSNRYALSAMLRNMGMKVIDLGIVADTPEATEQALLDAASMSDCILTSGGVSVGEEDHVKAAVEKLGQLELWKLSIKPGKPLAYGEVQGVPFFGLPGNPVSTFVTFHIVARQYLLAMQGLSDYKPFCVTGVSDFSFKGGGRREYLRVQTQNIEGQTRLSKFPNQGSGIMTSVVWADALAMVEAGQVVRPGDRLTIYPLALC